MKALVIGNGAAPARTGLAPATLAGASLVIAADGGAATALALDLRPDLVVGDADSLGADAVEALRSRGIPVEIVAADKDESDLELAVRAAVARGATEVVLLGALGGERTDHTLANVALLGLPALRGKDVRIEDAATTVRLLIADEGPAGVTIRGRARDLVTLLPWGGDTAGVVTDGLRFPLRDEPLRSGPSRGLSNQLVGDTARVTVRRGRLLVIHTRRAALTGEQGAPTGHGHRP